MHFDLSSMTSSLSFWIGLSILIFKGNSVKSQHAAEISISPPYPREGSAAKLVCSPKTTETETSPNLTDAKYRWLRNKLTDWVDEDSWREVNYQQRELILPDLRREDDRQNYSCEIQVDNAFYTATTTLKVEYFPRLTSNHTYYADVGQSVELRCDVISSPTIIDRVWSFGGQPFEQNIPRLYFKNLSAHDFGPYVCSVKYKATSWAEAHYPFAINLLRRGRPERPRNITLKTRGTSSLVIGWKVGHDGGYPPITFKIQYRPKERGAFYDYSYTGTAGVVYNPKKHEYVHTIRSLRPGTNYEMLFRVVNSNQFSSDPVPVEFKTKGINNMLIIGVSVGLLIIVLIVVVSTLIYEVRKRIYPDSGTPRAKFLKRRGLWSTTKSKAEKANEELMHEDPVGSASCPKHKPRVGFSDIKIKISNPDLISDAGSCVDEGTGSCVDEGPGSSNNVIDDGVGNKEIGVQNKRNSGVNDANKLDSPISETTSMFSTMI